MQVTVSEADAAAFDLDGVLENISGSLGVWSEGDDKHLSVDVVFPSVSALESWMKEQSMPVKDVCFGLDGNELKEMKGVPVQYLANWILGLGGGYYKGISHKKVDEKTVRYEWDMDF